MQADKYFTPFEEPVNSIPLPDHFTNPFDYKPHKLCLLASQQLQHHLETQTEWEHNFGLAEGMKGPVIGKMFGVLVVKTDHEEIGYLSAFSGTLASVNHHAKFVPPVYDGPAEDGFLNEGMAGLGQMGKEIKSLETLESRDASSEIHSLKQKRKTQANALTDRLFEQYHFLNQDGEEKSLLDIFKDALNIKPPGGAGECAAPKLLQYAFEHKMKPIAMAEFFWGLSRGSDYWQHKQFYPACTEKCKPILGHMLKGMGVEEKL